MDIKNEMILRAVEGDQEALETIVSTLEPQIHQLAFRMLLNVEDAQDATQESLIRIVTRMSTYNYDCRFTTWAWRVALNRIIDFKKASKSSIPQDRFIADIQNELLSDEHDEPANRLILNQLKVGCSAAMLNTLDIKQRASFILCEIMGFSSKEASDILCIDAPTIRKQVSRSKEKLRKILNHCGIVNPTAYCRCNKRITTAQCRNSIPHLEFNSLTDLESVGVYINELEEYQQLAAFYNSEPMFKNTLRIRLLNIG